MGQPLRLLVIDDNESDVALVTGLLKKGGLDVTVAHLAHVHGLEAALGAQWDAILLDYVLPGTTAPEVLRTIRARNADVPVIALSGRIAEQELVDVMRAGAQDYVLKSAHMARLIPALQREVAEAGRRREQHALAAQLAQSRKLESVGRLAGGIAHDFNNLLGIISGYAELAVKKVGRDDPLQRNLEHIQDAAQRASELSRQLLAFSRRQIVEPAIVDLGEVVDNTYGLLARVLGEKIPIDVRREPLLGAVRVDPVQIEQVLINLAVNARDAMPGGGTFTLSLSNAVLDEGDRFHEGMPAGNYVVLSLCDTGRGVPFDQSESGGVEPFFDRRAPAAAFGLNAVRAVVRQCGGHLYAHSEPDHGTTFWLYFPRCDRKTSDRDTPLLATVGTETILLVEDQAALREVTRDVLETGGYRVLSAPDPTVALDLSDRYPGPIEVLVTEMAMARMPGPELAQALVKRRPGMKVLFLAGSTDDRPPQPMLNAGMRYVPKPVTFQSLARALRDLVNPAVACSSARLFQNGRAPE